MSLCACVQFVPSSTTVKLPSEMRNILPHGQRFSDVRKKFFRRDAQGRLIVGGPGGFWAPASERSLPFR